MFVYDDDSTSGSSGDGSSGSTSSGGGTGSGSGAGSDTGSGAGSTGGGGSGTGGTGTSVGTGADTCARLNTTPPTVQTVTEPAGVTVNDTGTQAVVSVAVPAVPAGRRLRLCVKLRQRAP